MGKANYCQRGFVRKGLVKVRNFQNCEHKRGGSSLALRSRANWSPHSRNSFIVGSMQRNWSRLSQMIHMRGDNVIVQDGGLAGWKRVVRHRLYQQQLLIWFSVIGQGITATKGSAMVKVAVDRAS